MKKIKLIFFTLLFIVAFSFVANAQDKYRNAVKKIITKVIYLQTGNDTTAVRVVALLNKETIEEVDTTTIGKYYLQAKDLYSIREREIPDSLVVTKINDYLKKINIPKNVNKNEIYLQLWYSTGLFEDKDLTESQKKELYTYFLDDIGSVNHKDLFKETPAEIKKENKTFYNFVLFIVFAWFLITFFVMRKQINIIKNIIKPKATEGEVEELKDKIGKVEKESEEKRKKLEEKLEKSEKSEKNSTEQKENLKQEVENLKRQITDLKRQITDLKEQVKELTKKGKEKKRSILSILELKKLEYLASPHENGFFWETAVMNDKSIYSLYVFEKKSDTKAVYRIIDGTKLDFNYGSKIMSACELSYGIYGEDQIASPVKDGVLEKEDDKWIIKTPCVIKLK